MFNLERTATKQITICQHFWENIPLLPFPLIYENIIIIISEKFVNRLTTLYDQPKNNNNRKQKRSTNMFYIKYFFCGSSFFIIATTDTFANSILTFLGH